ncbi:MAG: SMR family transporter [Alteraurantiacibacter sp.]
MWTGIGAVGAFIIGIVYFGEAVNFMRITAAALFVSGLIIMKLATPV